jgi:hypothetical protein
MLVRRLSISVTLLLLVTAMASAQNVFRVRIDTMTVKPGDTATVNVYYTFTSTKPHNLNGFVARFLFDSNIVQIPGYITNGTACEALSATESHRGIATLGAQEIDFKNPVLFRMRVAASKSLSDTAMIRWDPDFPMFSTEEGVDTAIQTDGWIRTALVAAHTVLSAPSQTVHGIFTGPYADSEAFDLPVTISDISSATVTHAQMTFAYDRNRLAVQSVSSKLATASVTVLASPSSAFDTARIELQSSSPITGSDTLIVLHLYALIGPDTTCTSLMNVTWLPLNAEAKLGSTDVQFDTACQIHLFGLYVPPSSVEQAKVEPNRLYPNPASDHVISTRSDVKTLEMYDAIGRIVAQCERQNDVWLVPPSLLTGVYRIVLRMRTGETETSTLIIERP